MNYPPEDLYIAARTLDPDFGKKIDAPDFDEAHAPDWRNFIPPDVRRLWGRMDEGMRLVAYVVAESNAQARARRLADRRNHKE